MKATSIPKTVHYVPSDSRIPKAEFFVNLKTHKFFFTIWTGQKPPKDFSVRALILPHFFKKGDVVVKVSSVNEVSDFFETLGYKEISNPVPAYKLFHWQRS